MAYIAFCRFCQKQVIGDDVHSECAATHYEDQLARVQEHLRSSPEQPLPAALRTEIVQGQYISKARREEEARADDAYQTAQLLHGPIFDGKKRRHHSLTGVGA